MQSRGLCIRPDDNIADVVQHKKRQGIGNDIIADSYNMVYNVVEMDCREGGW